MSDMQDKINQILSNPEALKQVQSLGEQLGLSGAQPAPSVPPVQPAAPLQPAVSQTQNADMMRMMAGIAPLMNSYSSDDETTALLNALRPFLSAEKAHRLDQAQRMIRLIKIIPLIKDSGMFF